MSYYLSFFVNTFVGQGKFPDKLKVVPVLKKKDPHYIECYRIVSYLNTFKLLTPYQRGFREGYTIETASKDLIGKIYECLDKKKKHCYNTF